MVNAVFMVESFLSLLLRIQGLSSCTVRTTLGTLHYYEKRAAKEQGVVVFLHGIGASAGHYSKVIRPLWKAGYSIILPDLPGHGRSPDPDTETTPEVLYQIFVDWAEQVVPGKFILIGNSLGGALSLRYCLDHPSRLERLILTSPAGGFEDEQEWETFRKSLQIASIQDSKGYLDRIHHRSPLLLPLFYPIFLKVMARKGIRELIQNSKFDEFQVDREDWAKEEFPPTLMIWGKSERIFPSHHLQKFKRILPSSVVFEEPENTGHCPQLDSPEWFWKRICAFIGAPK